MDGSVVLLALLAKGADVGQVPAHHAETEGLLMTTRYRHKVRGSTYRVLHQAAKASSIIAALDGMPMVVYLCEADGVVWVRPATEFFDGRFEQIEPPPRSYCQKCGCELHGEQAWVNDEIWCHPCADALTPPPTPPTGPCL
jgi:hypothetical protein